MKCRYHYSPIASHRPAKVQASGQAALKGQAAEAFIMIKVNKPNFELNQLYINSNLSLLKNVLSLTLYELITSSPLSFVPLSTKPNLDMNILCTNSILSLSNDDLYYLFYELLLYRPHLLSYLFQIPKDYKGNHRQLP